jgi:hypothetical protein
MHSDIKKLSDELEDNAYSGPMGIVKRYCPECGKEFEIDLSNDPFTASFTFGIIDTIMCDSCADAKKLQEEARIDHDHFLRQVDKAGIPLGRINWDSKHQGANVKLYDWIKENAANWLFVSDDYDTNKTWCFCAIGAKLVKQGVKVKYWRVTDLLSRYAALAQDSMRSAERFKNDLANCDLLILDDLGKRQLTESTGDAFYSVIDKAYSNNHTRVWINANVSGIKLVRRFTCEDTGEAVISRFKRSCKVWMGSNETP